MDFTFDTHNILSSVLTILILALGWFIRKKDQSQKEEMQDFKDAFVEIKKQHKEDIEALWKHHHIDSDELKAYKLEVSEKHYPAAEIDKKFEKIENTISKGFEQVMDHLSRLNTILLGRAMDKDK